VEFYPIFYIVRLELDISTKICGVVEFRENRRSERRSLRRGVMSFIRLFHMYCPVWVTLGMRYAHSAG
jgi:hypothetical protein